ncbi:MAG: FAD-dependent oxidoreductase [Rubrimonas sp.]|uniref:FAD-dependent oxidoreductase n=1 Tax=Rubrimonas sp. TaxID=2036015 RepID=UPI002FDDF0E3
MDSTDILVVGGGLAGLAAAARLASDGARVIVADKAAPPPVDVAQDGADLRTTAFLQPAIDTLRKAGAWEGMAEGAEALWTMRILDAGGRVNAVRERAEFDSGEMGERPFGFNVRNTDARRALEAPLRDLGVEVRAPAGLERLTLRDDCAFALLGDGSTVRAQLVIGADGRDSGVRDAAGIAARRWRYGQKALVFAVRHPRPHGGASTEIHRSGGPFTLVPMPDADGWHMSSVVWLERAAEADRLAALPAEAFEDALNARSLDLLGRLEVVGRKALYPIICQISDRMAARRVALMAEAVHVISPIGAQGLNMSLADLEDLAGRIAAARAQGRDIGGRDVLSGYQRRRWPETAARVAGVDALNRAALAEAQPLRDLRRLGLAAVGRLAPLRRTAMRIGMGMR